MQGSRPAIGYSSIPPTQSLRERLGHGLKHSQQLAVFSSALVDLVGAKSTRQTAQVDCESERKIDEWGRAV
jgi:hypothetical protein